MQGALLLGDTLCGSPPVDIHAHAKHQSLASEASKIGHGTAHTGIQRAGNKCPALSARCERAASAQSRKYTYTAYTGNVDRFRRFGVIDVSISYYNSPSAGLY